METNGFLFCTFVHTEFWKKVVVVWKNIIDVDSWKIVMGIRKTSGELKIFIGREY